MKKRLIKIVAFFLLTSCSLFERSEAPEQEQGQEQDKEKISSFIGVPMDYQRSPENTPAVDRQFLTSREFGPLPQEGERSDQRRDLKNQRDPIVALVLAPSLYRSLFYLGFIDQLRLEGIDVHIIIAHEMAAVMMSQYAKNKSVDRIEWEFFRLISDLSKTTPYRRSWKRTVFQYIDQHFDQLHFHQLSIKMVFPVLSRSSGDVVLRERGLVSNKLKEQFYLKGVSRRKYQYYSALEAKRGHFDVFDLVVADIFVYVDALAGNINFYADSQDLSSLYNTFSERFNREKSLSEALNFSVVAQLDNMRLDESKNLLGLINMGRLKAKEIAGDLLELIK